MKQWRNISGSVVILAASLALAAQDQPKREAGRPAPRGTDRVVQNQAPPPQQTRPQPPPPAQAQPNPGRFPRNQFVQPNNAMDRPSGDQQRQNRRGKLHPFGARAGDWLRQYKNMPVDQQEQELSNDPNFRRLPAEKQEKLRERLRQFNNLTPEKQDQLLDRMEKFETLTPEKRQQLRGIQDRMRQLPEDRQQRVKRAFHAIKGMNAEQRMNFLGSSRFTGQFTPEEQEILRGLTEIEDTPELAEPNDPRSED